MKFGPVESRSAQGCILAHATQVGCSKLPKGRCLTSDDVERLLAAGIDRVIVARLGPDDLPEDEAAATIADALASDEIGGAPAATGRANLFAGEAGVFLADRRLVDAINRVHPGITLATLDDFASVEAGRMVATVKIIPLAVPRAAVEQVADLLAGQATFRLAPFRGRGVGLVQTTLPGMKPSILDKTASVLAERLKRTGSNILREERVGHDENELRRALSQAHPDEAMTIVFGASAVIDEDDVIPAAIRLAGGQVDHLGMPVDPGNLLLLGHLGERIVIGAPGCARSPRENGFDWVLDRLLADLPVSSRELTGLGVGGLLMEIASRPQPREINRLEALTPRVAIVVLAAGRSSRMGGPNKLLARFDGQPLLRRSVETALACGAVSVHVVLGHRSSELRRAIEGLDVVLHDNPDYAEGLSTSLKRGFEAASQDADGVLVMLADQPLLTPSHLDTLIAAFEPSGEGSIVLACDGERRANPVILSSDFREDIARLEGDVGARQLVQQHHDIVREIDIGSAASFDVDTPELMEQAGGILPPA
ncbi:4-diphosphocytidyl-2C-methyl-D-erythritol kinase [Aureimonas ureilytica]|uniref:4-diphosphocytidyl-2C-methyl-D-erythritol kinase n=1 Tax=Aureimonas ureilytica TaxID=401562 RepID=A0A175RGT0_9HYPH|nr:molybdopterin-binding/glycosyltransferase family 2 protein [Aureimonas ureilytica]KTR02875.1 4-diphosphocytidyl-2C-methyl-D-erythritol kinase [Aureimonas ureilytica]